MSANCLSTTFEVGGNECRICDSRSETQEHDIIECSGVQDGDPEIRKRLGLHEDLTNEIIGQVKSDLEPWGRETKEHGLRALGINSRWEKSRTDSGVVSLEHETLFAKSKSAGSNLLIIDVE